jgi:rhodanese-related sulfurtransferase/type 1 glutamine amidotransferase
MNATFPTVLLAAATVVTPQITTFAAPAARPHIVLISGEYEYKSAETLPVFAKHLESTHGFNCTYLVRREGKDVNDMPGLEALERADLAILYIRRMTLPEEQLARFRKYAASGKPIIGLRTASHAFENWKEWDRDVLGGNYHNHHGNKLLPAIRAVPGAQGHAILKGVPAGFTSTGSLYKNAPLPAESVPLLMGTIPDQPAEPVAWTHSFNGARVFYTSLGHPDEFTTPAFRQLLVNAIHWALDKPAPVAVADKPAKPVVKRVGVDEFEKLAADKRNVVLDVRTADEFAASHIEGAVNLDVNTADFAEKAARLDKDKTYLVHCAAGRRSANACAKLSAMGFPLLYDLEPGFRAWEKAGKKVVK